MPSSDVLRAETVPAGELDPDVGRMLELEPDQPVHVVCRRRLGDGEPLALEESYFPARRFPDLLQQDLGASIYGILATCYSVHPVRAHQEIEPTLLPASAAAALGSLSASIGDDTERLDHAKALTVISTLTAPGAGAGLERLERSTPRGASKTVLLDLAASDAWREWHGGGLAALADHGEGAMATLQADGVDVGADRFGDSQPVQRQQRHEGVISRR